MSGVTPDRATLLDGGFAALRDRMRVLDATWLAALLVFLIGLALPWYLRVIEIELGRITWVFFGYAVVYLAATVAAERLQSHRGALALATALHAAGVLVLGLVWYLLGGPEFPMFLLAFVMPVVASGILALPWQPYALAALGIITVWSVAIATSASVRWYLVQLDLPMAGWLTTLPLPTARGPFPALDVEPAYVLVLMELFAILLFVVALTTASLTAVVRRLTARLGASGEALREAEGLAQRILRASLHPTVLVDRSTHRVVEASESFVREFLLEPGDLAEQPLPQLLGLPFPEPLHAAIAQGGEIPFAPCRIRGETRVARISAYLVDHAGTEYAHVSLHNISDLYYLQGALQGIDAPYLLLGTDRRLLYFNRAAESLFGQLYTGMPASGVLEPEGVPPGWWDPAPRRSHRRQLSIKQTAYQADLVVGELPGHSGRLTVVTLRCAEAPT